MKKIRIRHCDSNNFQETMSTEIVEISDEDYSVLSRQLPHLPLDDGYYEIINFTEMPTIPQFIQMSRDLDHKKITERKEFEKKHAEKIKRLQDAKEDRERKKFEKLKEKFGNEQGR